MRPLLTPAAFLIGLLATPRGHAEPPIVQHQCSNGLTVLVVENHAVPLVTVEIAVKNGSMTETPEYNGLSHLYEHMFFKANKAIPSQEAYLARMRELGISFNGSTDVERVNYFFTTTSDHAADAMVFMRDAIVSPLFDEKELAREREVVVGEIDRNLSSPEYHLWLDVTEHVFWKYPSRKNPLGDAKTVRSATPEKMRTIKDRYYVPNNSVLVVTGDVLPETIFAQTDSLYASWPRGPDPFVRYPLVKHPPIRSSEVVLVEQPVSTIRGTFEWQGPSTVGKNVELTYAADLLGTALAEPSSRFQKALVDSGACTAVSLSWYTQMNVGPVSLSFEAPKDRVDACVTAIVNELPHVREPEYVTREEMENAVRSLEVQRIRERERSVDLAGALTFWWTSAGLDYYLHYIDNMRKVGPHDIARYLDTYVLRKPFVLGVMVSPEMAKGAWSRAHFEELADVRTASKPGAMSTHPTSRGGK
jgi:zinc protease